MGNITCPLPTGHSYVDVKNAYDQAKKSNPGLTPAAWRKAAAQSLGMDYKDFLAVWKTKGKVPLVPGSVPTAPSVSAVPKTPKPPTTKSLGALLKKNGFKKQAYTKPQYTHKGELYGGGSKMIDGFYMSEYGNMIQIKWVGEFAEKKLDDMMALLKSKGYAVDKQGIWLNVNKSAVEAVKEAVKVNAAKKAASVAPKAPAKKAASSQTQHAKYAAEVDDSIDGMVKAYANGELDLSDIDDILGDLKTEFAGKVAPHVIEAKIKMAKIVIGKIKQGATVVDDVVDAAGVIQTELGPLTHDLAKSAYAKIKKTMPGATPAEVRKATAAYLKVDYSDFLKAWKKPTTAAQKAKTVPANKLPDPTTPPTYASPAGKYKGATPTAEQVKDELAKLYGPGANKGYMSVDLSVADEWHTLVPKSLVPTQAGVDAIAKSLQSLGFNVNVKGHELWLWTDEAKKLAAKNAAQVAKTGTTKLPDGMVVLDRSWAEKRAATFYDNLDHRSQQAWDSYTAGGYSEINRYLRGKGGASDWAKENVRILSKTMEKTKHEFKVIRDTTVPISQFKVGALWTDPAFMSTTILKDGVFGGSVRFEILVTPGTKGRYIGRKSSHPGEQEFLLDKGTEFRVLSVVGKVVKLVTIP